MTPPPEGEASYVDNKKAARYSNRSSDKMYLK